MVYEGCEKMEVLKIHLTQTSANYKREEVIQNKMTYPLPPFSTVIGALHNICAFKEYKPMDISIQGDYHALSKVPYVDHCFLNSTQDDRGILVKMHNSDCYSKGYKKVAYAMKPQNNSFINNKTVMVEDEELIKEYRVLKELKDRISEFKKGRYSNFINVIKQRKSSLSLKKKRFQKISDEYKNIDVREKEIRQLEKDAKERLRIFEKEKYFNPISEFKSLTTSLKYYEILSDIELIIHVKSEKEILNAILEHIYDLKSLGRSEDFVEVRSAAIVALEVEIDNEYKSTYHAYLDADLLDGKNKDIMEKGKGRGIPAQGTKYYINKNYKFIDNSKEKRIFEKKKVYYMSEYKVDQESRGVYIDKSGDKPLIVNFL
jgi:CRISPR-associated protein Cas5t